MADETAIPEQLASALAQLHQAVEDKTAGLVDEEKVRAIATEVAERQIATAREAKPSGYSPEDSDGSSPSVRTLDDIQLRSAASVSRSINRPLEDVQAFQRAADNVVLLDGIMRKRDAGYDVRQSSLYRDEFQPLVRAMDSTTSSEGDEWVPTILSSDLIQRVNLQLRVAALFPQINMPSNPFDLPGVGTTRTRLGKVAENTADSGQTGFLKITPATRKVTLTAVKFAGEVLVSREAEEDAIVAMLPWINTELADYLVADLEDAIINGDTTASHQDSNVTASTDPRKNWNGLRKLAQAGEKTNVNAVLDTADLLTNRKEMGRYGADISKLAHIVSFSSYINLLADTNVQTLEKYGSQATILQGELGRAHGVPIIVSEYVQDNLNATGVYDGTTTTKTIAITVHRGAYVIGNRRAPVQQTLRELYAEYDQDAVVISTRKAFSGLYSTDSTVAVGYNVTV